MSELKITKGFMSGVVSRLISKMLNAKLGCDVRIDVESISATVVNGKTQFHLDIYGDIDNRELNKLLNDAGI